MKSKFQILFSIEVLHNFFTTGRWDEIKIVPTPETEKFIRENDYSIRQIGNELLIIARTDSSGKVYHIPDLYTRFSFLLIPQSPGYLIFSNIPFTTKNFPIFHFHNLNKNEAAGKHFISKIIEDYNAANAYLPGQFAKGIDGFTYESIAKNNGGGSSVAPDDANPASKKFWVLHGNTQLVSSLDTISNFAGNDFLIEAAGNIYNFKTTVKKTNHTVRVFALRTESMQYEKEVLSSTVTFDATHDLVQIDMNTLPSGLYRVQVNNDTKFIYLIKERLYDTVPVFIDIYNLPDTDPQSFIDISQKPKRTRFTISFGARRVLWRYTTRTDIIDKIDDTDGEFTFKSDGLKQFVSESPIPFSDGPRKSFVAKNGTLSITSPLPNPYPDKLLEKQNDIYTTESFINF